MQSCIILRGFHRRWAVLNQSIKHPVCIRNVKPSEIIFNQIWPNSLYNTFWRCWIQLSRWFFNKIISFCEGATRWHCFSCCTTRVALESIMVDIYHQVHCKTNRNKHLQIKSSREQWLPCCTSCVIQTLLHIFWATETTIRCTFTKTICIKAEEHYEYTDVLIFLLCHWDPMLWQVENK